MRIALALALGVTACGSGSDDGKPADSDTSSTGMQAGAADGGVNTTESSGGSAGVGGTEGTDAAATGGGSGGSDSNENTGSPSTTSGSGGTGISPEPGDPGCGLEAAAFCDTFDSISDNRGRAGELDIAKWSASRAMPALPSADGQALPVRIATLPACRSDLPEKVYPDDDFVICDANSQINSNHLLVAVGAQNYGQNTIRARQPFDFAGRTGKIVFDADGYMPQLIGWLSIAVTEDPEPIPSYAVGGEGVKNNEGGAAPRRGFLVQFTDCPGDPQFTTQMLDVFEDYKDTIYEPEKRTCLPAQQGSLHHFEITVSQQRIEVYATPYSDDGVTFGEPQLLLGADVDLPFSRGYVQFTVHNHASIKYSEERLGEVLDAWIARFDNLGFDGPIVENWREYEVPDSLVLKDELMSVGYRVPDQASDQELVVEVTDVDLENATSARLAIANWYLNQGDFPVYTLRYRVNAGDWIDRPLNDSEFALLSNGHNQGSIAQMLDVPLADLKNGTNSIAFQTVDVGTSYPSVVSSIDLVLRTD